MKEILKELRIENRYSQELLAKILGISRQAYMKYESGEVEPSVEVVRRLSKIYKVSYSYLIDNGKFDEKISESEVRYNFSESTLSVAEPEISFSTSTQADAFSGFYENLQYIKQIINSMEKQLADNKQKLSPPAKSRSFNKNEFFKNAGEINLDSSYIDELRENSLI